MLEIPGGVFGKRNVYPDRYVRSAGAAFSLENDDEHDADYDTDDEDNFDEDEDFGYDDGSDED